MIGLDLSRCVNDWFGPKCVHKKQVIWGIISTLLPLVFDTFTWELGHLKWLND